MDMGQPQGPVEVGAKPMDADPGQALGVTFVLTLMGDKTTLEQIAAGAQPTGNGQEMDFGEALSEIVSARKDQMAGDDDEANFQSGLGASGRPGGDLSGMGE